MSVAIKVNNVVKKFGDNVIIPGMSVNIKNGEFFTLLGPNVSYRQTNTSVFYLSARTNICDVTFLLFKTSFLRFQ